MSRDFIITEEAQSSRFAPLFLDVPASLEWSAPHKVSQLVRAVENLRGLTISGELQPVAQYHPSKKTISVSARLLEVLWAQSYGYSVFYKRKLAGVQSVGQIERLDDSPELCEAKDLIRWAAAQMAGDSGAAWPSARPSWSEPLPDFERIARQQSLIALTFVFHHELAHHRFQHRGSDIEQEKDADAAAADWLLDGYDPDDHTTVVRALGASVALLFLSCRGIHTGDHGGTTHPPGYQRLLHSLDRHVPADDDYVWSFVSAMLDLHMQATGQFVPRREYSTWRGWCDVLVEALSRQ